LSWQQQAAAAAAVEPEGQQQQQPSQEAAAASSYSAGILIGDWPPLRYGTVPGLPFTALTQSCALEHHQPYQSLPEGQPASQARVIFLGLTFKRRRLRVCD